MVVKRMEYRMKFIRLFTVLAYPVLFFVLTSPVAAQTKIKHNPERCSPENLCAKGEGGCQNDSDCESPLVCSQLAGSRFGLPEHFGVCTEVRCNPIVPAVTDWEACTPDCPCPEGWGDCDEDDDCVQDGKTKLFCGDDFGHLAGMNESVDICMSSCPVYDKEFASRNQCNNPECPCGVGEGDCDADSHCESGLVCRARVGAWVGLPESWDVCEPPFDANNIDWEYCTKWGCGEGEGDCDNDSHCKPGLYCVHDIGPTHPSLDICTVNRWKLTANRVLAIGLGTLRMPNGSSCGGTCSTRAQHNQQLSLTAYPGGGSKVQWTGCTQVIGNTCRVTMTGNRNVTARFVSKNELHENPIKIGNTPLKERR